MEKSEIFFSSRWCSAEENSKCWWVSVIRHEFKGGGDVNGFYDFSLTNVKVLFVQSLNFM